MTLRPESVDAFTTTTREPPAEQQTLALDVRERVSAVILASKHGGTPHVVGVVDDPRFLTLTCTCRAYLGASAGTNTGCWAMKAVRAMLGGETGATIDADDSTAG